MRPDGSSSGFRTESNQCCLNIGGGQWSSGRELLQAPIQPDSIKEIATRGFWRCFSQPRLASEQKVEQSVVELALTRKLPVVIVGLASVPLTPKVEQHISRPGIKPERTGRG